MIDRINARTFVRMPCWERVLPSPSAVHIRSAPSPLSARLTLSAMHRKYSTLITGQWMPMSCEWGCMSRRAALQSRPNHVGSLRICRVAHSFYLPKHKQSQTIRRPIMGTATIPAALASAATWNLAGLLVGTGFFLAGLAAIIFVIFAIPAIVVLL